MLKSNTFINMLSYVDIKDLSEMIGIAYIHFISPDVLAVVIL